MSLCRGSEANNLHDTVHDMLDYVTLELDNRREEDWSRPDPSQRPAIPNERWKEALSFKEIGLRTVRYPITRKGDLVSAKPERDVEKDYPLPEFIDKLRRLADDLEQGKQFEIMIAGERIYVPLRAVYNIEHEREGMEEEIEFQIKWKLE